MYLASVMDLYSRKIVGWQADKWMTKEIVLTALDKAHREHKPTLSVLHHSDRGSQYASHDYQDRIAQYGMRGSMSRKGNCFDNACIESFHSVIKREMIHLRSFETRAEAKQAIFEYIECFYNRKRIHSAIGYVSPCEALKRYVGSERIPA